jgi:hypothetical protein
MTKSGHSAWALVNCADFGTAGRFGVEFISCPGGAETLLQGDKVAARWTAMDTCTGPLLGASRQAIVLPGSGWTSTSSPNASSSSNGAIDDALGLMQIDGNIPSGGGNGNAS